MDLLYPWVIRFAQGVFAMQGVRLDRTGTENIPTVGGAVIAMNHISYFDFAYGGYPAHDVGRLVRFMAKKEVFDHRISGPLMRGMKHIPVDRSAGAQAYAHAVQALRHGELVGVFPEATISRSFELKEFKSGAVRMAQEAGVPVVPLVLWGSQRVWTKGLPRHLLRVPVPVLIDVGAPISWAPDADPVQATGELRENMMTMLHALQDRYGPLTGADAVFQPARLGGAAPTPEQAAELDRSDARSRRPAG